MKLKEALTSKTDFTLKQYSVIAMLYLILPVIVFFIGFMKMFWALFFSVLFIGAFFLFCKYNRKANLSSPHISKDTLQISVAQILLLILFAIVICILSGVGEFIWSAYDHRMRWATLNDLVNYKWPIIYDLSKQENPVVRDILGDGKVAFTYYYCFWLIPSLFGKLWGLLAARIALVIWASIGLSLVFLGTQFLTKANFTLGTFVLLFTSGLEIFPYLINLAIGYNEFPETWNGLFPIFGFFVQIATVANQCIPIWIIAILLLTTNNVKSIGFIGSFAFIYSPWATFGLVPIALFILFSAKNKREILSINNFIVPLATLIIFVPFYTSNSSASSVRGFTWERFDRFGDFLSGYIGCVIIEFLFWFILLYKSQKHNKMFILLFVEMMLFPLYCISLFNDFLMRGSIAPMFILTLFVIDAVWDELNELKSKHTNKKWYSLLLLTAVVLSTFSQFYFLETCIRKTITSYDANREKTVLAVTSFGNIRDEDQAYLINLQFYVRDYENNFFYKYLAK